ncbi:hypothetical protein GXM_01946 [Nostoc sphaeroides CCNUC1]|uniref:Uncharacterized protein n=1 Tax=Nostoc sphaeroides CCNUC1 TaxID=2653204 RepID=A0A5P8VVT9_9NOSO|nr:hypothetical protein GXM_01946 [Nostoc sphaeroides CCNUC1]
MGLISIGRRFSIPVTLSIKIADEVLITTTKIPAANPVELN